MAANDIEKALTVFQGIGDRDGDVATRYMHPTEYRPHNPQVADGIAGVKEWIRQLSDEKSLLRMVRVFQNGPYVYTNTEGNVLGDKIFFDIFRFEGGLIVEHWAFEEEAAPPNKSGHTQLDGPIHAKQLQDTEKNKSFVRGYYETVHLAGNHKKIPQ